MGKPIVGVRYIGLKDVQEDTVTNSGAIWAPGQVHNFSGDVADQLLVHTDSFERADVDQSGETYVTGRQKVQERTPIAYTNLNAMDVNQLVNFAKFEFNRTVQAEGKTDDEIRSEVRGLMQIANLEDEENKAKVVSDKYVIETELTKEEYEALQQGLVVLKLVPVVAEITSVGGAGEDPNLDFTQGGNTDGGLADAGTGAKLVGLSPAAAEALEAFTNLGGAGNAGNVGGEGEKPENAPLVLDKFDGDSNKAEEEKSAEEKPADKETKPAEPEAPTLQALVASLDKKQLIAFAKQEGVKVSNTMTAEKLREKLLAELGKVG